MTEPAAVEAKEPSAVSIQQEVIQLYEEKLRDPSPHVEAALREAIMRLNPGRTFESFLEDPAERADIEQLRARLTKWAIAQWQGTLDVLRRNSDSVPSAADPS